jgi:hypothetical protein
VELNPVWLGEAKTGHFDEGTSRGTSPATAGAFDDAGGAAATSPAVAASLREAPATRCHTPLIGKADPRPPIGSRHQFTNPNFATAARQRRRRKLAGLHRPRQTNSSHTSRMRRVSPFGRSPGNALTGIPVYNQPNVNRSRPSTKHSRYSVSNHFKLRMDSRSASFWIHSISSCPRRLATRRFLLHCSTSPNRALAQAKL